MSDVTIRNVYKSYGSTPILERLNLSVPSGSFCTIVGASGCGKSTFLKILLGQEQATRGSIMVDDTPLPDEPGPDRGIVFQRYSVFPNLTVRGNLMLAADFKAAPFLTRAIGASRKRARNRADELLEQLGLKASADQYPHQLSGGMQQRLAIGQTLMQQPPILLLDEPFGALDPGVRADMHELILDVWQKYRMTIFMVTHDIAEAFKLGTRLLVFNKVRDDPQFPAAYGATITYDLPIDASSRAVDGAAPLLRENHDHAV